MTNTTGSLMTAWYDLLDGQVTVNSVAIPVFKEDAPESEDSHYILLRAEGGVNVPSKNKYFDETVVITDIVTVFENNIDRSIVESIDGQINALILPTKQTGLVNPSGVQITNVQRETFDYITEQDVKKYYRKISRYIHKVLQK